MSRFAKYCWLAAALVALPLPAAAQEMCAALSRIAAAAQEQVPFASLQNGAPLVPGYDHCRVETGTAARAGGVYCHQTLAPVSLVAETVGAQVRDCLGAVPGRILDRFPPAALTYRTDTLSISVTSYCNERCHVGRLASIDIRRLRADEKPPPR